MNTTMIIDSDYVKVSQSKVATLTLTPKIGRIGFSIKAVEVLSKGKEGVFFRFKVENGVAYLLNGKAEKALFAPLAKSSKICCVNAKHVLAAVLNAIKFGDLPKVVFEILPALERTEGGYAQHPLKLL